MSMLCEGGTLCVYTIHKCIGYLRNSTQKNLKECHYLLRELGSWEKRGRRFTFHCIHFIFYITCMYQLLKVNIYLSKIVENQKVVSLLGDYHLLASNNATVLTVSPKW